MGKMFQSAPIPKAAKTPAPVDMRQVDMAGEDAIKKQRRKSGFESTFMGGNLTAKSGKKTTLG
jgi:hypothetical protein